MTDACHHLCCRVLTPTVALQEDLNSLQVTTPQTALSITACLAAAALPPTSQTHCADVLHKACRVYDMTCRLLGVPSPSQKSHHARVVCRSVRRFGVAIQAQGSTGSTAGTRWCPAIFLFNSVYSILSI
jgi:hypothetical protein